MKAFFILCAALLWAPLAWAQSSWPAGKVLFSDSVDLQTKVNDGTIAANAASGGPGPKEIWIGQVIAQINGANPASQYLQLTEIAHLGETTGINFTNNQARDTWELSSTATDAAYFVISGIAYSVYGSSFKCQYTFYRNDVNVLGERVNSDNSNVGDYKTIAPYPLAAAAASFDLSIWSPLCNFSAANAIEYHSFVKIERW